MSRTAFTIIVVGILFLLTSCTDTIGLSATPPATAITEPSAPSPTVISSVVTDTPTPPPTFTPTATWTFTSTPLAAAPTATNPPQQATPSPTEEIRIYSNAEYGYSLNYPGFLSQATHGTGAQWTPADRSYAIFVLSYEEGANPGLEFHAIIQSDETTPIARLKVRKLVGIEVVGNTGTLIHVGPISHKGISHMLIYSSGSQAATPDSLEIFDQMLATFHFTN
jgi:hypothetical protein